MGIFNLLLPQNRNGNFYRKVNLVISVFLVLCQSFIITSRAYYLDNNPYRHKQVLGPKASYVVEWSINWKERSVLFQVSAETKGWVGFGLSKDGRMAYSDAIIGGVDSFTGKPYFNDVHVTGNRSVRVDEQQDWKLIGAWEKGKRTYLSFSRAWETCDYQDHPITKDLIAFIWAYGETDELQYHQKRRGSAAVYLLDPSISGEIAHHHYRQIGPHSNLYLVQRWAVTNRLRLSSKPASVWCSVERAPTLPSRHDIVGMGAFLPTSLARQHVQKMLLYRCTSPQQTEAATFFDPYAKLKGEECYLNEKRTLPISLCRELVYVWGRGGQPFYFPEDIGIPIGESPNEYFLLETHFDNSKGKTNVDVEAGIEVIYSHRQKQNSASLLQIGYGPFGTFMIPPKTTMSIYGSCGSTCTSAMFPQNGVNVFAAMFHSHSLGSGMRIKHIRGGVELPWILKDDNYDSEFQQMRLLSKQVTILPGDQLTTQCTYDSKNRDRTSFSGFSANDEACSAFLYVSTRVPFFRCTSEMPAEQLLSKYGIRNFTWDLTWQDRYVTEPKQLEGTWIGDVVDDGSQMNELNYEQLQQDLKYSPQLESCPNIHDMIGRNQNHLVPTNEFQQKYETPVATKTPHITSSVTYPRDVEEYHESPLCNAQYEHPITFDQSRSSQRLQNLKTSTDYAPVVPAPPPPVSPPVQRPDFDNILDDYSRTKSLRGGDRNGIPRPTLPAVHGPKNNNNFLSDYDIPKSLSGDKNVIPRPTLPPVHGPNGNNFLRDYNMPKRLSGDRNGISRPTLPAVHGPNNNNFVSDYNMPKSLSGDKNGIPRPTFPPVHGPNNNVFDDFSRPKSLPSVRGDRNGIPTPSPPPQPPRDVNKIVTENKQPYFPTGNRVEVPVPPSPSQPPVLSEDFNGSPLPVNPSVTSVDILPIPPPPSRPPTQHFGFDEGLTRNRLPPTRSALGLRIPLVETNQQPVQPNDKSIMNFFEQIANIFSSPSSKNDNNSQNGFSFQQLQNNNF